MIFKISGKKKKEKLKFSNKIKYPCAHTYIYDERDLEACTKNGCIKTCANFFKCNRRVPYSTIDTHAKRKHFEHEEAIGQEQKTTSNKLGFRI
jgi:hypothetical protein